MCVASYSEKKVLLVMNIFRIQEVKATTVNIETLFPS